MIRTANLLSLFPYPIYLLGQPRDGSLLPWPDICLRCRTKDCQTQTSPRSLRTCPYGLNYIWVDSDLMTGGFVTQQPSSTPAHRKRLRTMRDHTIPVSNLTAAIATLTQLDSSLEEEFANFCADRRRIYEESAEFRSEILAEIRTDLERPLSQAHDYTSLLRQISVHVQTLLERELPGVPPEDAANQLATEGSIYYAVELMLQKLDAMRYLVNPNLIAGPSKTIPLHRYLTKYIKIYRGWAKQRHIDFKSVGDSYGSVRLNSEPLGTAFHAVLDNAVKYAPSSSSVTVRFDELPSSIRVDVISLGPQIEPNERTAIFRPGFRAAAAQRIEGTGLGLGLATAKLVADQLDFGLTVDQETAQDTHFPEYYETHFRFEFSK